MTVRGESAKAMMLIGYESLTGHGLALPLFARSPAANALHIAVPSKPGDPTTYIQAFELYSTVEAKSLDVSQFRSVAQGEIWIDVFIWCDTVHVGTRAELWESTGACHEEMERSSPLSLLALAEGIDRAEAARCAVVAYDWLTRDWGSSRADRWRVDSYLTRLARRDLLRRFSTTPSHARAAEVLELMQLARHEAVLQLKAPRLIDFKAADLPDLVFAVDALGWRLEIVLDELDERPTSSVASPIVRVMVMRLRHGRGRTQTQIPLRVMDGFFAGNRTLRDARTGRLRTMTLSKAGEARNTVKLQLPEIAEMTDPVARFERRDDGVIFEIHDASSSEGQKIANLLSEGIRDGSTRKTQRDATWWRLLPDR